MSIPFHPHGMCVWGDIPIGLGTSVVSFKPSGEACQTSGECINHLHHVHHTGITILTSWLLNNPIPFVISRFFWPLITCILQCPQLMTIWSSVSLLSTVMTEMLYSWTSLWFMKWFLLASVLTTDWLQGLFSTHWLATFFFFSSFTFSGVSYNWLFGLYKFHFFGDIGRWATPSDISQPGLV